MSFQAVFHTINKKYLARQILRLCLIVFTGTLLAGSLLAIRILVRPLPLNFAVPYIENALQDSTAGVSVRMDSIALSWPKIRGPVILELRNGRVYSDQGRLVAAMDEAALGLSKSRLLIGQIAPISLILKKPALRIIRHANNSFQIGLDQPPDSRSAPIDPQGRNSLENVFNLLTHQKGDIPAPAFLSQLISLQIDSAKVMVDDQILNMSWIIPRLDTTIVRKTKNTVIQSLLQFEEGQTSPPLLNIDTRLEWETGKITMDALLEHFALSFLANRIPELSVLKNHEGLLDARLQMQFKKDMTIEKAVFALLSGTGNLNIPELSPAPVPFSNAGLFAEYNKARNTLELKRAQLTLNNAVNLKATGNFQTAPSSFSGPLTLAIDHLDHKDIKPIWPAALKGDVSETWIVERLSEGAFSNVFAKIDLTGTRMTDDTWDVKVPNINAGFDFDNMRIHYRPPLTPVTHAKGHGEFDLNSELLKINVEQASLMDMDITKGELEFANIIEKGKGKADIHIKLKGPLKSALTYVQDEPIAIRTPIDIPNSAGEANITLNLVFPTHPDLTVEEVEINAKGTLENVKLPNIVKNLTLTSEGAPLALHVADNLFQVTGKGALEGQPVTLSYEEFINAQNTAYSSKVRAQLTTTPSLRERFGVTLDSFLEGPVPLDITYTKYQDGKALADIKADLKPARLFFDPLAYEKKEGEAGDVTLKAVLENDILKDIKDLKGKGYNMLLEPSTLTFRQHGKDTELSGGKISRFTMNETVGTLAFTISESGQYALNLTGPFLDSRPFLTNKKTEKPYTNPPIKLSLAMDRMRTTDEDVVQYPKIKADIDGQGIFNMLEMEGIAGSSALTVHYKPDSTGKRSFFVQTKDAGAALKAFGVYNNLIGGEMLIRAYPVNDAMDRNLKGVGEIKNFKVVKAPALARLVGALSLPGVLQLLNNEGLIFTRAEAQFNWHFRPQGSLLVFKDGRTSGNAMGLTFDGQYDHAEKTMNVSGTVIPLSGVNKIIGNIPLIGDIITGGTGSLIAATYTMKGPTEKLQTSVNPLSVLTPGILRRILFEEKQP